MFFDKFSLFGLHTTRVLPFFLLFVLISNADKYTVSICQHSFSLRLRFPPVFASWLTLLTRCEHLNLSVVYETDRSWASSRLPVDLLLSAPVTPGWCEAQAGAGRRGHFSSVCHPGWLQLVEEPPLGVFLAPHTPACLPTFLPACTTPSAWCSHNTPGTCRLIFYLRLAYTHLAATHTHLHISPRPPPVNLLSDRVHLKRRYL